MIGFASGGEGDVGWTGCVGDSRTDVAFFDAACTGTGGAEIAGGFWAGGALSAERSAGVPGGIVGSGVAAGCVVDAGATGGTELPAGPFPLMNCSAPKTRTPATRTLLPAAM